MGVALPAEDTSTKAQKGEKKYACCSILFYLAHNSFVQIVLGNFEHDTIFILTVDGVHCQTYEARKNPTAKVYSHKSHGPALAYELGIAIYESRLVWMKGPFDASVHDITMFRSELEERLKKDKKQGIGDSGYRAGENMTVHRKNHTKDMTNFINRTRARHENFNARIKSFNILSERFRSDRKRHRTAFEAIYVLCQYDMENGHPLMEVYP